MIADAVGAILLAGITLYGVLGGADFGGGFWDLLAGGDVEGSEARHWIDLSITPVWEANHVWLIFSLVIFWTAFSHAFADVVTSEALPLWLVVFGIVLRGSGFAFRKQVRGRRARRICDFVFALSSVITPFFMGAVIGAVADGAVPANATHSSVSSWTSTTSLLIGLLFVAACAYLAAAYLTSGGERLGDHSMAAYFASRTRYAGIVTGGLSLAILFDLDHSNARLFHGLTGRALPLVVIGGVCGAIVLILVTIRHLIAVRYAAGLGVASVIWGWGVAQFPTLLPGTKLTIHNSSAPAATLVSIVVIFVAVGLLILPSLGLLFHLQGRRALQEEDSMAS